MQTDMYCPKCGALMKSDARYCMRCGYLNAQHAANEGMKEYINVDNKNYEVGSGQFLFNHSGKDVKRSFATGTGNKFVCFFLNYVFYLISIVIAFYYSTHFHFLWKDIIHSFFPILSFSISLFFLYLYSLERIFMKCNRYWWAALIPVYNMMVLADVVWGKKWLGLCTLIPFVGIVFLLILFYQLGESFGYNGVLSALFPFIFIPFMGFSVHSYKGYIFVDDKSWFTLEREYASKRIYLFSCLLFLLIGLGSIVFTNFTVIKENIEKIHNYYYLYVSRRVIAKVKLKTEADNVLCDGASYNPKSGTYYFNFDDVKKSVYVPFLSFSDPVKVSVLVDNNSGESQYYISLTNGKVGFPRTLYQDLRLDIISEYSSFDQAHGITCHFIS